MKNSPHISAISAENEVAFPAKTAAVIFTAASKALSDAVSFIFLTSFPVG
nr:MAG TPA: hypothetical protein [Caudoviricetes sp.]